MPHFFCKLVPPRPTFTRDMTDAERKLMGEHAAYWRGFLENGQVVVYGPVADPAGAFGIGVVEMESAAAVEAFGANDPTVKASVGFRFEFWPMPSAVYRKP